jgi:hypothetical protein
VIFSWILVPEDVYPRQDITMVKGRKRSARELGERDSMSPVRGVMLWAWRKASFWAVDGVEEFRVLGRMRAVKVVDRGRTL